MIVRIGLTIVLTLTGVLYAPRGLQDHPLPGEGQALNHPDMRGEQRASRNLQRRGPAAARLVHAPKPVAASSPHGGRAAGALNLTRAGMWDRIASCESGRRWDRNSGNGFYGGLQFVTSTWLAHGGGRFAPRADLATREQQITIANHVSGNGRWLVPWPACSRKLGLR